MATHPGADPNPVEKAPLPPENPEKKAAPRSRDPLHGITLKSMVNQLVEKHGWKEMARRIPVRCFQYDPTVKSSLTFLRKTPWAREKIEDWFIQEMLRK